MLSIKDINEVSFRKSNFSGYNSDDVDQFIDEVLETVTALTKENAEIKTRKTDDSAAVQQLQAKNAELQEKLSILAAKIESYRAEEDGIKDAILSAQRLGNASIREAKAKAEKIVNDANAKADALVKDAKGRSETLVKSYEKQIAAKEKELENMKREVTNFRASLYGIYKEHLAVIEKIPTFDLPEEEQEEKAPAEEPTPVYTEPEVIEEPEEEIPAPVQPQSVYDKDSYIKEQFSGIGLDLNAYADIPESLQKEKEALFSTLEFGVEDEGDKKKGKFKRR